MLAISTTLSNTATFSNMAHARPLAWLQSAQILEIYIYHKVV